MELLQLGIFQFKVVPFEALVSRGGIGIKMSVINVVKNIKEIHISDVVLIKNGKFYNVYGKDAYIISYLFDYKLKKIEDIFVCGFPYNSLNLVIAKLEDKKINYLIVDKRNNYEVDDIFDNKNLNRYHKYFEKAKQYVNYKIRLDNIYDFMLNNIEKSDFKDIIMKLEKVINEGRKV